jgi:predicted nuclease of predicted toxin-antitoxin system
VIRFYADENVDERIVRGLRLRGVDVLTALAPTMIGRSDEDQLSKSTFEGRVLITSDQDFLRLDRQWSVEGKTHSGIIFYSQYHTNVGTCIWGIKLIADLLAPEDMVNHVEFISS